MTKTYRHKHTGDIAVMKLNNSSFYTYDGLHIHARIVENSNDWELVVEYPVGTKVVDTNPDTEGYTYEKQPNGKWKMGSQDYFTIEEKSIGENKRFKLVEEKKEWEILSLKPKDSNIIYEKGLNIFSNALVYFENGFSNLDIHSIKRLSDGEIFTIGDEIDNKEQICNNAIIEKFNFDKNKNILVWVHNNKPEFKVGLLLNNIKKSKPILFTTEDGKGLKEGDFVTTVDNNYLKISIESMTVNKDCNQKRAKKMGYLWFSTKEKAIEYIMYNKPILSLNDVASIYPEINKEQNTPSHQAEKLKELVKSKI